VSRSLRLRNIGKNKAKVKSKKAKTKIGRQIFNNYPEKLFLLLPFAFLLFTS
jgi:hypothetical protein